MTFPHMWAICELIFEIIGMMTVAIAAFLAVGAIISDSRHLRNQMRIDRSRVDKTRIDERSSIAQFHGIHKS